VQHRAAHSGLYKTKYSERFDLRADKTDLYGDPEVSVLAEKISLKIQSAKVNFTKEPDHMSKAMILMEQMYTDASWSLPGNWGSDEYLRDLLIRTRATVGDKTPGHIYMTEHKCSTVESVFVKFGVDGVLEQFKQRISAYLAADSEENQKFYVSDPVRLFVKKEAHSLKKIAEKRWRLIWAISFLDQLVDRMLYEGVVGTEIRNFRTLPSQVGRGILHGETDDLIVSRDNHRADWISFDASGFDISMPAWALDNFGTALTKRLNKTPSGPILDKWTQLLERREKAVLYGTFCFSDGETYQKIHPCIQTSGRFTTICFNSRVVTGLRLLYHVKNIGGEFGHSIIAMGDDTVQSGLNDVEDFVLKLKEDYGITFTIESEKGTLGSQNFCSSDFLKTEHGYWVSVPKNVDKHMYNLAHPEKSTGFNESVDTLGQYCLLHAYGPHFERFHEALKAISPISARSVQYYQDMHLKLERGL
jgi:hypothetical protein